MVKKKILFGSNAFTETHRRGSGPDSRLLVCNQCESLLSFYSNWINGDVSSFFFSFSFFCFAPVTLRDRGECTLCRAFISWPEGRRNITSAKSNYSGSRLPVWSCAPFKQTAARFPPKPPRLQDGRPSASRPTFAFNPGTVLQRRGKRPL